MSHSQIQQVQLTSEGVLEVTGSMGLEKPAPGAPEPQISAITAVVAQRGRSVMASEPWTHGGWDDEQQWKLTLDAPEGFHADEEATVTATFTFIHPPDGSRGGRPAVETRVWSQAVRVHKR